MYFALRGWTDVIDVDSVDFVHKFMKVSKYVNGIPKEEVYSHWAFRLASSGMMTASKNGFRTSDIESLACPKKKCTYQISIWKGTPCKKGVFTDAGFSPVEDVWTVFAV